MILLHIFHGCVSVWGRARSGWLLRLCVCVKHVDFGYCCWQHERNIATILWFILLAFFSHSTPNNFKHRIIFAHFFLFRRILLPLFIIRFSAATAAAGGSGGGAAAAVCAVAAFKSSNIKMILFHDGNYTQIPTIEVADKHQQCRWYWLYVYVVEMVL